MSPGIKNRIVSINEIQNSVFNPLSRATPAGGKGMVINTRISWLVVEFAMIIYCKTISFTWCSTFHFFYKQNFLNQTVGSPISVLKK